MDKDKVAALAENVNKLLKLHQERYDTATEMFRVCRTFIKQIRPTTELKRTHNNLLNALNEIIGDRNENQ